MASHADRVAEPIEIRLVDFRHGGLTVERPLAGSLIDGVNGEPDDRFVAYLFGSATSLEWDVDPDGVFERMELASQELGDDEQAD